MSRSGKAARRRLRSSTGSDGRSNQLAVSHLLPSPPTPFAEPHERLLLVLLLAGALLLRLPNLGQSLWYDEVVYTGIGLTGESLRWVLTDDLHPPLYALILLAWIHLVGDSEVAVRLPSLVCGLASLVVVFALAKRWFGARVAWLAGALMALSPVHIWYSQENKTNTLMLLLTACLVWTADRAWQRNRGRDWGLFALAAVLAPWTNVFALWVLAAVFLWLWAGIRQRPWRARWRPVAIVTVVAACPFLPLFLSSLRNFETMQPSYLRPFTAAEAYKLLLIYLSHGNTLRTMSPYASLDALLQQPWPFFLVDGLFAVVLLAGLARLLQMMCATHPRRIPSDWSLLLLLLYFVIPLVCVFVASQINPHIYIERSMLILLPPYVIVLAAGVFAVVRPLPRRLLLALLLALNGVALFNLFVAKADRWTVYKQKNDWRSTAQYFNGEMQEATTPLVIVSSNVPISVLVYYDRRMVEIAGPDAHLPRNAGAWIFYVWQKDAAALAHVLRRAQAETFYVVEDTYWSGGTKQLLERVHADPDFQPLGRRSFKGVRVFKFTWLRAAAALPGQP